VSQRGESPRRAISLDCVTESRRRGPSVGAPAETARKNARFAVPTAAVPLRARFTATACRAARKSRQPKGPAAAVVTSPSGRLSSAPRRRAATSAAAPRGFAGPRPPTRVTRDSRKTASAGSWDAQLTELRGRERVTGRSRRLSTRCRRERPAKSLGAAMPALRQRRRYSWRRVEPFRLVASLNRASGALRSALLPRPRGKTRASPCRTRSRCARVLRRPRVARLGSRANRSAPPPRSSPRHRDDSHRRHADVRATPAAAPSGFAGPRPPTRVTRDSGKTASAGSWDAQLTELRGRERVTGRSRRLSTRCRRERPAKSLGAAMPRVATESSYSWRRAEHFAWLRR
jgi:hypothetical protein